jgi:hypothetical protein
LHYFSQLRNANQCLLLEQIISLRSVTDFFLSLLGGIRCYLLHKNKSEGAFPRFKAIPSGHPQPSKPCILAFVAERGNCFCREAILGYWQVRQDFVFLQRASKPSQGISTDLTLFFLCRYVIFVLCLCVSSILGCGVHTEQSHGLCSYRGSKENGNI